MADDPSRTSDSATLALTKGLESVQAGLDRLERDVASLRSELLATKNLATLSLDKIQDSLTALWDDGAVGNAKARYVGTVARHASEDVQALAQDIAALQSRLRRLTSKVSDLGMSN